jgi:hypothetical protein
MGYGIMSPLNPASTPMVHLPHPQIPNMQLSIASAARPDMSCITNTLATVESEKWMSYTDTYKDFNNLRAMPSTYANPVFMENKYDEP